MCALSFERSVWVWVTCSVSVRAAVWEGFLGVVVVLKVRGGRVLFR